MNFGSSALKRGSKFKGSCGAVQSSRATESRFKGSCGDVQSSFSDKLRKRRSRAQGDGVAVQWPMAGSRSSMPCGRFKV